MTTSRAASRIGNAWPSRRRATASPSLRDILSPLQLAAARRYSRALEARRLLSESIRKSASSKHNDELFRFLHRQTGLPLPARHGEMIIPSYTYLSAYREDADLERHVDRPQMRLERVAARRHHARRRRRTLGGRSFSKRTTASERSDSTSAMPSSIAARRCRTGAQRQPTASGKR